MNEVVEKAEFMRKPFELAKSSEQYIERLWKTGTDISKLNASIASLFSSIFNTIAKAVMRVVAFNREIRKLSISRSVFLRPFGLWSKRATPPEEEYFLTEMGRANVSFMFNVNAARKTAAELARRIAAKTPRPALLPGPAPLPEAELIEETLEERVEEPAKTVPHVVADLQNRFKSKLTSSIKGISSAIQEYSRQTIMLAPLLAMPKPLLVGPPRLEGPPSPPLVAPPEEEAAQVGLPERPLGLVSRVPSLPPKEAMVEPPPQVSMPIVRLRPLAARSLEYATRLASIVLEREVPMLKRMAAFSLVSPPKPPLLVLPGRQLAAVSRVPSLPPKEAMVEPPPQVSMPIVRLRPLAARSFRYATELPSIVLEHEIPILKTMPAFPPVSAPKVEPPLPSAKLPTRMAGPPVSMPVERLKPDVVSSLEYATELPGIVLEREVPMLKRMAAFSLVSPPEPPLPSIEPPYRHHTPTPLAPMRPSQVGRLLQEISPSLTSWIYGVSEVLQGTSLSLSAVPIAASTAEKVVTETLIQPVSSFAPPETLGTQEPVSPSLTPSRPETGVRRTHVEAFRLPAIVTSLIVALSQKYPLLFSEPTIGETYGTSYELTRVAPEETPPLGRMPEVKSFSKLPTVIALAAAESLIAYRLQHEFSGLIRQIQVARSSSGERLSGLSTFGPIRPTILGKLAAPTTPFSPPLEPYAPGIPSPPRHVRPASVSPAIQNTFNITISAESAEEDLRDLERKISRILSEQIRRYYGSPRV